MMRKALSVMTSTVLGSILLISLPLAADGIHDSSHWGYGNENGPANWNKLSAKFALCKTGNSQSPIDITSATDVELPPLEPAYQATPLKVTNNGHAIQVDYAEGSTLTIDGHSFDLKQFHFHSPSENRIHGESFPLEAHLVHADKDGNLAVVAVMLKAGDENAFLKPIWENIPSEAGAENTVDGSDVNVAELLPEDIDYYSFMGSLTTPPCTEDVKWMVLKVPVTISRDQIDTFRKALGFANNRPVQPLNERTVQD